MLATFVIGLREGLEAALIVGIIAGFLKRNGKSLTAMWIGVTVAVALSIAVGIVLRLVETALPQAQQEGMESIIGAIAIVFVTGMIVWMNTHSRGMKRELEAQAGEALHEGHAYALAAMAFLAVLKEGFETSVFLLATISSSSNALISAGGAAIGVGVAIVIGLGIYFGSVKLNLSKFFRITGAFLILVAAGLVITALRTAHEAGWLNAGQQTTIDLSWLVAPGSVQAALITGVLGIPADPRLIEVIGWLAYLVPVALFVYWPVSRRATGRAIARVQFGTGVAVAVAALCLAVFVPSAQQPRPGTAALVAYGSSSNASLGTAELHNGTLTVSLGGTTSTLHLSPAAAKPVEHNGYRASLWSTDISAKPAGAPATLTLTQLMALSGGRLPVGVSAQQNPGPFTADWATGGTRQIWSTDGALLDAAQSAKTIVTISGGGLSTPRTFGVSEADAPFALPAAWQVSDDYIQTASAAIGTAQAAATERSLWAVQLPIGLGATALVLAAFGLRSLRRARRQARLAAAAATTTASTPQPISSQDETATSTQGNTTYAAH